jgi:hypothetical protein
MDRRTASAPPTPWLLWAARLGYVARGVVYVGIGLLALAAAVGLAEHAGGSRRVVELVASLPFGRLLAAALAVGLLGYATLSFVAAVRDPEEHGDGPAGMVARAVDVFAGLVYLGLAAIALRLAAVPAGSGDRWAEAWAARVLASPYEPLVTAAVGAGLLVTGLSMLYKSFVQRFATRLDRRLLDADARRWLARLHRAGTAARGVVFAVCGALLLGLDRGARASDVRGLDDALEAIGRQRFGPVLLALVALGFVAYGAYQLAKARWRRMEL